MAHLSPKIQNRLVIAVLVLTIICIGLAAALTVSLYLLNTTATTSPRVGQAAPGLNEQLVDHDGVSRGFSMNEFKANPQNVYQIVAYPRDSFSGADYPAVRASFSAYSILPLTNQPNDYGYLWVGATLNNKYFIQAGLATSHEVDANGNMEWHVFWQVWNDKEFIASFDDKLSNYSEVDENTFGLVCVDPELGEWEFRINGQTFGRTTTGDCAMNVANSSLAFEVVSDAATISDMYGVTLAEGEQMPTQPDFGNFTVGDMEYWDGAQWNAVPKGVLSYSYGDTQTGTRVDQDAICPPYGASPLDERKFMVGSSVECAKIGSLIWTDIPTP